MFIAVVIRKEFVRGSSSMPSRRSDGSLAAFAADNEDAAVEKALAARDSYGDPRGAFYDIVVGEMTKRVSIPRSYKVVKL